MKQGYFLLITLMFSMGLQAQTLKETIRGKFGEYQGTSETRVRGGKTTTVYRDKYGVVTGTSETRTNPLGKTTTIYRDKYGQKTGTSISGTKGAFSPTTTTVYKDRYGQKTGTSTYRHSGNKGTITYRDKYGQVTGRGQVRGRIPSKSSSYSYWVSSSKSKR